MRMLLEVEGRRPEQIREFARAEEILRELRDSGPHSFASLTRQDASYVQAAGGRETCLLEKRDASDGTHWRAYMPNSTPYPGAPQVLKFGGGQIELEADEVFSIEQVVSVWRSFFESRPFPAEVHWRDMTDMFRS